MEFKIFKNKIFLIFIIILIIGVPTIIVFILLTPEEKPPGPNFVGGTITEDTTWSGHVYVQDNVIVPQGVTLRILPGTFIEFKHFRGYKNVSRTSLFIGGGNIKAIGTPDQQIRSERNTFHG